MPDDSGFNEAFATAVELEGVQQWLTRYGSARQQQQLQLGEQRRSAFHALLADTRSQLETLYRQPLDITHKREQTGAAATAGAALPQFRQQWHNYSGYDYWFQPLPNNAWFVSQATYQRLVPAFRQLLLQSGHDWQRFYRAAAELGQLPRAERERRLQVCSYPPAKRRNTIYHEPLTANLRPAAMKCPFCHATDTQVVDSRVSDEGDVVRRRRKCAQCQKRFTTYETIELRMPQVVKQNGQRAEFDREKLRVSFMRALHKRPVPTTLVDEAIDRIAQKVLSLGEREVASRQIGEMVWPSCTSSTRSAISALLRCIAASRMSMTSAMRSKEVQAPPKPRAG